MKQLKSLLLVALLVVAGQLSAQFEPIPMNPKIRYGKLDNGLTYYIQYNKNPKQRAEFHIAQKVGAILEEDNQNGLAHFLEHMAFNGTKNFPDKGIINYFETLGIKFGVDINAYTSLDKTVYRLSNIPTTRTNIVDSALLVLHDWSGFITLNNDEIDKERGVIMEEWRTRNTAWRRMWKKSQALKFPNSQYAKRDVIGDTAIIQHFSYKALKDYYKKWYHPDLQAVIVVGDIDVDRVEKKIKEMFSDIPKSKRFGIRPVHTVEDNKEPIFSLVIDPEASQTTIKFQYKKKQLPKELKLSQVGFVMDNIHGLISLMLGERFQEIALKPEAPFVGGYGFYSDLVKEKDAFTFAIVPKEGKEKEALKALLYQGEKMTRYGFTNAELERAKTNLLSQYEKIYNERESQKNQNLAEEYIRNFLDNEEIAGAEYEYNLIKAVLPKLSLAKVNDVAKNYITDENV
ncbi:MAG: peptidase M16, partial [Paludibacter sp.]